jgi:hypothetical protein
VKKEFGGHFSKLSGECGQAAVTNASECFSAAAALATNGSVTRNATVHDSAKPPGCLLLEAEQKEVAGVAAASSPASSSTSTTALFNSADSQVPCGAPHHDQTRTHGSAAGGASGVRLSVEVDGGAGLVTITMEVNDTAAHWYAVGFNASAMDGAYAIVIDGGGGVSERTLGDHNGGHVLDPSPNLTVVSQTLKEGKRLTVLTRPLTGASAAHYTFSTALATLPFISAVGSTSAFSQHRARSGSTLSLLAVGAPTCVCRGGTGKINGFDFAPHCMGEPRSDLLKTHNPTCDLNLYSGGMSCCRGNQILLDADQDVPALVDEVWYRWRFYFEEYAPERHKQTFHIEWQFGHIEYDVPKAPEGTPPELAVHVLTTRFTGRDLLSMGNDNAGCAQGQTGGCGWDLTNASRRVELVVAGFHCHSPACLGGELYNADTNELLCRVTPLIGKSTTPMDEESYLWLPPCQWGDRADGLLKPPIITLETNLLGIKRANASVGHFGVMAIFQGRAAYAD